MVACRNWDGVAMPLRRVVLAGIFALLAGCAGPDEACPGYGQGPGMEARARDTLNHVCARPRPIAPPLVAEVGNVWPAAAPRLATMLDVQREAAGLKPAPGRMTPRRSRAVALCRKGASTPPPGVALGLCV